MAREESPEFVMICGKRIHKSLTDVKQGRYASYKGAHLLLSKGGNVIAVFENEEERRAWWDSYQRFNGRPPQPLPKFVRGRRKKQKIINMATLFDDLRLFISEQNKTPVIDPSTLPTDDVRKPDRTVWNSDYDMPEF